MRLLFVADGRSPIAIHWMRYFVDRGHEVHLASTFAAAPDLRLASFNRVPVAFSAAKTGVTQGEKARRKSPLWSASLVNLRTAFRQWLGPFTLPSAARRLLGTIEAVQPDLVHAMRIPYEGMLAALCLSQEGATRKTLPPLLVSVWGNDFTLHAPSTPWMGSYTRLAMHVAAALHADCRRDIRLAKSWGFPESRPWTVLPGAGGVHLGTFYPSSQNGDEIGRQGQGARVVNPRGFRAYVRNDTFFQSIPRVLDRMPAVRFACPLMAGEDHALRWVNELGIAGSVDLLPPLSRAQMADLFRQAQVAVSPSTHDGTPNTLLEAMACGCFPVAGDLESIREWITPGVNGLLVDPGDPQALAEAVLLALEQPGLRSRAAGMNMNLVSERAEYGKVMGEAETFYRNILKGRSI